jgi:thymidine kinase
MQADQQTLVIPERVTAVRAICRACQEAQVEQRVDDHFGATVDGSLRLEDRHGWVVCRCGHRIELIRAGLVS